MLPADFRSTAEINQGYNRRDLAGLKMALAGSAYLNMRVLWGLAPLKKKGWLKLSLVTLVTICQAVEIDTELLPEVVGLPVPISFEAVLNPWRNSKFDQK